MSGRVLVTSRTFGSGTLDLVADLERRGLDVVRGSTVHDPQELAAVLADAVAWIAGTAAVTADHLDAAPRLRVVARYGVGTDAVDLAGALRRGVTVTNTPGVNAGAVAEHALALLLAALRHVVSGDRAVRRSDWGARRGREISNLRCGVVGYGRIGSLFAQKLAALGASVLATDPLLEPGSPAGEHVRMAAPEEIADCDVVSLHAPGGQVLVDDAWLRTTRPGAILVNTARAELVDEHAVADALRTGRLACYATDLLGVEGRDARSPLLAADLADRMVATPHVGAQTTEAVDRMGSMAVDNVLAVLAGEPPPHPVGG